MRVHRLLLAFAVLHGAAGAEVLCTYDPSGTLRCLENGQRPASAPREYRPVAPAARAASTVAPASAPKPAKSASR